LNYLHNLGKAESEAIREYSSLTNGIPFIQLKRACNAGDGILQLDIPEKEKLAREFFAQADRGRALKFIAASGAANRMFNSQMSYRSGVRASREQLLAEKAQSTPPRDCLATSSYFVQNGLDFHRFTQRRQCAISSSLIIEKEKK
jgi:hypothetical protein